MSVNLSIGNIWYQYFGTIFLICNNRDESRSPTTSKMGLFVTLVNSWKPLSNVTKSSILDVAGALDMSRNNVQKQPWRAIPSFTCTLLFLGKKCVTEVEDFKLVCLEKPILETALAALNNLRGDKLRYRTSKYFYYRWYGLQS